MAEMIKEFWALIAGLVGLVAWAIRLEAGMLSNRKDIRRMEDQRKEDLARADRQQDKIDAKLDDMNSTLQKIWIILGSKEDKG